MRGTILVADDHPLFGQAIEALLRQHKPDTPIQRAADVSTVHQLIGNSNDIAVVLLDLHMPGAIGFSTLCWIKGQQPKLPVIVISANTHPITVRRAFDHGAAAFLGKSTDEQVMLETIEGVLQGEYGQAPHLEIAKQGESLAILDTADAIATMTAQQMRVASMLVEGQLNKQIAYELGVKEATIKAHMTEIFKKLGVHSRTQAVLQLSKLLTDTNQDFAAPLA